MRGSRDLSLTDHVLAGALAGLSLALAFIPPPRPGEVERTRLYLSGALSGLLFAAAPLVVHAGLGRPFESFGLGGWRLTGLDAAAAAAWAVLLLLALVLARLGPLEGPLGRLYGHYGWLMPRTRAELGASWLASAAAGAGEEIAYRGFLLVHAAALLGPGPGLIVSSLLFGAAHGYQRRFGMIFATAAGLFLGAAYLATESLILVMWMHASYNVASFTAGWMLLRSGSGESEAAPL